MKELEQINYSDGMTIENLVKELNKRLRVISLRQSNFEDKFNQIYQSLETIQNGLSTLAINYVTKDEFKKEMNEIKEWMKKIDEKLEDYQ